jgi:hypothetical protein
MNHKIEYFHTLVEDKFNRDQYDVSYENGKYIIKIIVKNGLLVSISSHFHHILKNNMIDCIKDYLRPEKYSVSIFVEPIKLRTTENLIFLRLSEIANSSN